MLRAPFLNRKGKLRGPQQQRGQGCKKCVQSRIQPVDQFYQFVYLYRCRLSGCIQRASQVAKFLGFPMLAFETREKEAKDFEVLSRIGDGVRYFANGPPIVKTECAAQTERRGDKPAATVETEVVDDARNHVEAQDRRENPCHRRVQQPRPRAPTVQPFGVDCRAYILT
jgi:hypothetical protein